MDLSGKRVLVVDDEKKIVDVVKSYLEKQHCTVLSAGSGAAGLKMYEDENPELLILDWMLPDLSGEELCRIIRQTSTVPIIMLTAKVEEEDIVHALGVGADDYITKPFSPRQLLARVEALLRRTQGGFGEVLAFDRDRLVINMDSKTVLKDGSPAGLTPNEFKIISALARHPQKVFTRDELITIVNGDDFDGYDRVIDTHIKNIRQKIESEPRNPVYIQTVHGVGYKFGSK